MTPENQLALVPARSPASSALVAADGNENKSLLDQEVKAPGEVKNRLMGENIVDNNAKRTTIIRLIADFPLETYSVEINGQTVNLADMPDKVVAVKQLLINEYAIMFKALQDAIDQAVAKMMSVRALPKMAVIFTTQGDNLDLIDDALAKIFGCHSNTLEDPLQCAPLFTLLNVEGYLPQLQPQAIRKIVDTIHAARVSRPGREKTPISNLMYSCMQDIAAFYRAALERFAEVAREHSRLTSVAIEIADHCRTLLAEYLEDPEVKTLTQKIYFVQLIKHVAQYSQYRADLLQTAFCHVKRYDWSIEDILRLLSEDFERVTYEDYVPNYQSLDVELTMSLAANREANASNQSALMVRKQRDARVAMSFNNLMRMVTALWDKKPEYFNQEQVQKRVQEIIRGEVTVSFEEICLEYDIAQLGLNQSEVSVKRLLTGKLDQKAWVKCRADLRQCAWAQLQHEVEKAPTVDIKLFMLENAATKNVFLDEKTGNSLSKHFKGKPILQQIEALKQKLSHRLEAADPTRARRQQM